MDILFGEGVKLDVLNAHGGLYKTTTAGQRLTAAALNVPVAVRDSAGEGGAWGAALLASYLSHSDISLEGFLEGVFAAFQSSVAEPDEGDAAGFAKYKQAYKNCLAVESIAVKTF
jgi:sugar (pentulose or hexulose) kinase